MAKWNSENANRKAQTQYADVTTAKLDMKSLMVDVARANERKQTANKRLDKKTLRVNRATEKKQVELATARAKAAAQDARAKASRFVKLEHSLKKSVPDEPTQPHVVKANRKLDELEGKVTEALALGDSLSERVIKDVGHALTQAKASIQLVTKISLRAALLIRLGSSTKSYRKLLKVWNSLGRSREAPESSPRRPTTFVQRAVTLGKRTAQAVTQPRKTVRLALASIGSSVKAKASGLKQTALGKSMASLASKFENSPILIKSIRNVDKSLRAIGSAVKMNGSDTLKWVGKQLSGLSRKLWGFMKAPFSSSRGFDLNDLMGLAVLGPSLLAPLLSGIDRALQEKYGEHYIKAFFSGVWSSAKAYVTEQISTFIDWVSGIFKPAIDAVKHYFEPVYDKVVNFFRPGPVNPAAPTKVPSLASGPAQMFTPKADEKLLTLANQYSAKSAKNTDTHDEAQAASTKVQIEQLLTKKLEVTAGTKQRLDALGFNTTNLVVTPTKSKPVSISSTKAQNSSVSSVSNSSATMAGSTYTGGSVTVNGNHEPMDGSVAPVIATPKSNAVTTPESSPAGNAATTLGGLRVGSIPVNVTSESMYALNLGVLA